MTDQQTPTRTRGLDDSADALLADRAADGDSRAFAALVRRYSRLLRWYAARVVGTGGSQDDVVQEALVTAWQQLPTLEDRTAVRGWLVKITTRKALDHLRAQKQHDDIDDHDQPAPAADSPDAIAAAGALGASLTEALTALPQAQARVWTLRELGGYSYDQIAVELEIPASTVRGLLARARRSLMQQMDGWR